MRTEADLDHEYKFLRLWLMLPDTTKPPSTEDEICKLVDVQYDHEHDRLVIKLIGAPPGPWPKEVLADSEEGEGQETRLWLALSKGDKVAAVIVADASANVSGCVKPASGPKAVESVGG